MNTENPDAITLEEAKELVRVTQKRFGDRDVDAIMPGLTDDVFVRFADMPEMTGKPAVEAFLRTRFARQENYELTKTLRMLSGNMVGNYWEGTWTDATNGKKMQGRGTEFWTMKGGKVAIWEATFNIWEQGGAPLTPLG